MGVVYLGRVEGAAGFSKPVVIKSVIRTFGSAAESEQLFAREARIVANLQHPNIVAVVDFGKVESTQVMVLEYVHGYHLGQWLRYVTGARGRMPVRHAVHVMLAVLDALAFAHGIARADGRSLGIVHRDVSPANVLIDVKGQVKLSDFGIARSADDEFKTQEGLFRGTLPYSAPEALQGGSASPAFDQYAAAVVLYQLLAGTNPFKGAEPPETVARVLTHVPAPVSTLCPDVPIGVEAAIAKALSKDPADRYPSVEDFARALRDACAWPEREAAEAFAAEVAADFDGPMATALGLESLAVRESSWRDAQEVTTGRRVSLSSTPPGMTSGIVTPSVIGEPRVPKADVSEIPTARVGKAKMESLAARAKSSDPPAPTARPASSRKPWLWIVLAALAAGAGSAAVLVLAPARERAKIPGVVVIEKQAEPPTASSEPVLAVAETPQRTATAASPEPVESAPAAVARSSGRAPTPARSGVPLAQAFQKQGGKIQRCFEQNPGTVQGFSVRFQIDTAGKVENAAVTPASVAATPLGACIVGVARATAFGPQPEPVAFSIPIAARVVKR
jgi:serine/threonine-protein kinase